MIYGSKHPSSFRSATLGLLTLAVPLWLVGCGGDDDGGDGTPANAYITDANKYIVTSSLAIPRATVQAGADLRVCWTSLSTDLLKHPLDPTKDIDHVSFGQIKGATEAEIERQLAIGTFDDKKLLYRDYIIPDKSNTCANFTQFKLGASVLDPAVDFVPLSGTAYMLMWAQGLDPGVGVKTMMFLEPDPTSTVTEVTAPQGKDILTFTADFTTPQKVDIPAAGPYVVDWSGLSTDAFGQPVVYANLSSILVAHYPMTVAELEAQVLDFEIVADAQYRAKIPVGQKQVDLATATMDDGTPFSGFTTATGFWGVAIMCKSCQVPAPVSVSILNPI